MSTLTGRPTREAALTPELPSNHPYAVREKRTVMNYALRAKGLPVKICSRCLTVKALPAFNRYSSSSDGRSSYCRSCHADYHTRKSGDLAYLETRRRSSVAFYWANAAARRQYSADRHAVIRQINLAKNSGRVQDPNVLKRCAGQCGQLLPETEFRLDRGQPDGLRTRCRDCAGRDARRICREAYGAPAGQVCYLCLNVIASSQDAQADHLLPVSLGGPDVPSNLWWTHGFCNGSRGARALTAAEWERVRGFQRQAEAIENPEPITKEAKS
ncbi:hypothetical protein ACFYXD_35480 [Streptomyces platensis]|uniref:hypothetical protein n=1 Tax=Streptomyces platensis TaxID=58346 RepID=UPI0036B77DAA